LKWSSGLTSSEGGSAAVALGKKSKGIAGPPLKTIESSVRPTEEKEPYEPCHERHA